LKTTPAAVGPLFASIFALVAADAFAALAPPVLTGVTPNSPANNNAPKINGTAISGATVSLFTNSTCGGAAVASAVAVNGKFSIPVAVADNTTTRFYARAQSGLNSSVCTAGFVQYVEDSKPPTAPVLTGASPSSPSSSLTPQLQGTAEGGSTVQIFSGASCAGAPLVSVIATTAGTFLAAVNATKNASNVYSALALDAASNKSACSGGLTFVNDSIAPAPPVFSSIVGSSDLTSGTVQGDAESGSTVTLYLDSMCQIPATAPTAVAGPGTKFSIVVPTPAVTETLYATARDAAGNVSLCSPRPIVFAADHPECPDTPFDQPISRAPIYWEWNPYNKYLLWKDDPTAFATYMDEIAQDKPALVGPGGWGGEAPLNEANGAEWGPIGTADHGTSTHLYGAGTNAAAATIFDQGSPDPQTILDRIAEHKTYMESYAGRTRQFNYMDFGTQVFGDHATCMPDPRTGIASGPGCRGFWDFYWNQWDNYAAAGLVTSARPPEPNTWLTHSYDDSLANPAYPAELAGLAFFYWPHNPDRYGSYYRYTVNIASQGWAQWWPQILKGAAKSGFKTSFIDNVVFRSCWNAECQQAYLSYLQAHFTQAEIDRYFTVTTSLQTDHSFELYWYQQANGDWATPYAAIWSGKIYPDVDAVGGAYSARLEGPSQLALQASPTETTGSDYDYTVHYKTATGIPSTFTLYTAGVGTTYPLPPSDAWTSVKVRFHLNAGQNVFPVFQTTSKLWIDELWLSNVDTSHGGEVDPYPTFKTALYTPDDIGYDKTLRFDTANRAWDALVDDRLVYLKQQIHAVPEGQDYAFVINSGAQRRGTDYFTREGQIFESERQMQEVGSPPGRYDVGDGTHKLRDLPVTSPVLATNVVDWKWNHQTRFTDEYAYALHLPVVYPENYAHNPDTVTLAHAEAAAFGGGGATELSTRYYYFYDPYKDPAVMNPIRGATRQFFDYVGAHDDLYHCLTSTAEIGFVLHDSKDVPTEIAALRLAESIGASGLTFDVVTKDKVGPGLSSKYKALVLHGVERIGEVEAQALINFMSAGGTVILSGNNGRLDDMGRFRAANPSTVWPPVALGAGLETHAVGSGWLISAPAGVTGADVSSYFAAHVRPTPSAFPTASAAVQSKLRVATWTGYSHMVAHVLNYDVPHGVTQGNQVATLPNLDIALPVQPGWTPSSATLSSPEYGITMSVPITVSGGVAHLTIPHHRIYTVIDIR
jgi:hypothetical protein